MDVYQAIHARHTIRDFKAETLAPELVTRLIEAGFAAPSNNHMREWHFVLLNDLERRRELLERVIHPTDRKGSLAIINRWGLKDEKQREVYLDAIPKQFSMLFTAGALILPFYKQPGPLLKPKSLSDLNALVSIWCVVENILVAAAGEGIFDVTRIPFADESRIVRETLKVPEGYEFPCWIALGYPAEGARQMEQVEIDPLTRIHINTWE
jgi:nitroreductase